MYRIANRLLKHWRAATPAERSQGKAWYTYARSVARKLARAFKVTLARAAGVLAALSPRVHWVHNVALARANLAGHEPKGLRDNWYKASRITNGERPLKVLSGPKVRAFYRAIMGDETAVVVDTWMVEAAGWTASLTPRAYELIARATTHAAEVARTTPTRLQAGVWVTVRGRAT